MTEEAIVVDGGPLPPDQVLTTQDLYSTDLTLSTEPGDREVREGGIAFGLPTVYTLTPGDFPGMERRPDIARWTYALVHFRFDLEPLSGDRAYNEAKFVVTFADPQAVALELYPDLVTTQEDVDKSRIFTLGPALNFASLGEISLGEITIGRRFKFTHLQPVITSFGNGQNKFSWTFTAQKNATLNAHGRATFAVLQLPKNIVQVNGSFKAEVEVSRRILGVFKSVKARTSSWNFSYHPDDGVFAPAAQ